jgi:hypothetical protein
MKTLKFGIHPGVAFPEYLALEAVDKTLLLNFANGRTAAHAHYAMTHPRPQTAALKGGDALHVALLEPKRFKAEYVKAPLWGGRSTAAEAFKTKWLRDHPNSVALTEKEYGETLSWRDAILGNPLARALLSGRGQNELTVIWKDKLTGLRCKARPDRFTAFEKFPTVVEVKTAEDASEDGFARACAKWGYHWQAAHYLDGLNTLERDRYRFIHIVVEKTAPYCVAVYEMTEPGLKEGRAQCLRAMSMYAQGMLTGKWPGYKVAVQPLDLPRWAFETMAVNS